MENPLPSDRDVEHVLYELIDVERLCSLPAFRDHGRATFDLFLDAARRLARAAVSAPSRDRRRAGDAARRPRRVHEKLRPLYAQPVGLGLITAARPGEAGGRQLPLTALALASA